MVNSTVHLRCRVPFDCVRLEAEPLRSTLGTKLLQTAVAFCFTARLSGDMLGSSLRGVTYAKALHRAAHLDCVACSSAATAGPKLWVSRQDVDPCTTDQDGASRQSSSRRSRGIQNDGSRAGRRRFGDTGECAAVRPGIERGPKAGRQEFLAGGGGGTRRVEAAQPAAARLHLRADCDIAVEQSGS